MHFNNSEIQHFLHTSLTLCRAAAGNFVSTKKEAIMKNLKKLTSILIASAAVYWLTAGISPAQMASEQLFEKALYAEEMKGDLTEAVKLYQQVLNENPGNRQVSAKALLHIGMCYEKLGSEQARKTYQDVISKYSDQSKEVSLARERITRLETYTAELDREAEKHMKNGNDLFKRWEYESAVKEYENAIKLRPNTLLGLNAQYCIGQSWFRAGKYDAALATFTKLIEENPKSNIAPVTELMVAQVRYAINQDKKSGLAKNKTDSTIVDPQTGITFRKIKSLTGESDIITYSTDLNLSPDGKFLLSGNMVVPMDGTAPFELIDFKSTGVEVTRGTWSPDGTKAAFYSGDALCVVPVSPETGHTSGLLKKIRKDNLKYEINPSWSPDSKMISYSDGDKADLCIIGADGNDFKQITDNDIRESAGAWSPDGKTIAYNLEDRYIGLYNIKKEMFSKLVETRTRRFPEWSPDGKWILDGYWREVYLVNLENRNELSFSPPQEAGSFFSWSPDKRKMLFFRTSYNSNSRLKIASPNGGPSFEPVPLLTDYWHIWQDDSKSLAVWGEDEKGNIVIRITPISGGRSDIIQIDEIPGCKPHQPSLDIDSKFTKIIFGVITENGEKDLYVVPISAEAARTTGPPVKFYDNFQGDFGTSLSHDGAKIVFTREKDIWMAFTNGDDPIRITDSKEVNILLGWTHDGTSLLFSTPSGWRLLKNPGPQGKIIKLLDEVKEIECSRFNISISPDNSRVAVLTDQQIKIIPIDGTKSGKVLDISFLKLTGCNELTWSPDGKNLAFIGSKATDDKISSPDRKFCIYNMPLDGGPPVRVAPDDDGGKYFLSWSPDGKWLAFSPDNPVKVRPESTIWEADFEEIKEKLAK